MTGEQIHNGATPADTEVTMTQLVLPTDTNTLGNLLGGRLLYWVDIVAALAATRLVRKHVATVSLESMDFRLPVGKGEMVMLTARVIWTGRTSLKVRVVVTAENMFTGVVVHTNTALLTFVAMDEGGRPCQVSQIRPATEEDITYYNEAQAKYEKSK